MRRVREARHLTVDDLHDETKIPLGLLEAFEQTALFDHPQFNRVYLRSFVRTYANVLGIEPDLALEALEEALSDRYTGLLAAEYLDEELDVRDEPKAGTEPAEADKSRRLGRPTEADKSQAPEEGSAEGDSAAPIRPKKRRTADKEVPADEPTRTDKGASDRGAGAAGIGAARGETRRGVPSAEDEVRDVSHLTPTTGEASSEAERSPGQEIDETEWTAQSPPRAKRTTGRDRYRDRSGGIDWRWIVGVVAAGVVAVIVWIVISVTGGDPGAQQAMPSAFDTTATVDTTMTEDTTVASRAVMPTLGDTMNVQIIAAHDKVDPIRVTVDDDLRRPYWLDQGDSMIFRPTNRIVIEDLLDNIELSIEGAEYPTNRRDELGRIVITRDSLRAYFRSDEGE